MKTSVKHYYHCATKGFDHSVLFADVREFIAGMNRIGICLVYYPTVIVIAFCLMDNHVHFILHGTREDCLKWMALYHRLTMIWQGKHRKSNPVDEKWEYDAWQIYDSEDLKQKIAYVLRNPTVAGMGYTPSGYRWSSASLYFSDPGPFIATGRRIGNMSIYESRKCFETRATLPEEWTMQPNGMIWPGCYTDYKRVEHLFGDPRKYLFSLNQNIEVEINQEMNRGNISLPDTEVLCLARERSKALFGTDRINTLDISSRIQLCKILKKQAGLNLKQLARTIRIPVEELKKIFA